MDVVDQRDAAHRRGQSAHQRRPNRVRVNQSKPLVANQPRQFPCRPQVEAVSHGGLVQRGGLRLAHRGESARLQTDLAHLEPEPGQAAGQQVRTRSAPA